MLRGWQLLLAIICLCSLKASEIVARTINPPSNSNIFNRPLLEVDKTELHKTTLFSQKTQNLQNPSLILEPQVVSNAVPFPQDPATYQSLWIPQKPLTAQHHEPSLSKEIPVVTAPTTMTSSSASKESVSRFKRQQTTTTEKPPTVLQQYFQSNPDGSYEQRFVLSNGAGQYERSFWSGTGKNRFLARRGYYSYPLSNGIYYTFFYTADDKGFHEDETKYSDVVPLLPESY